MKKKATKQALLMSVLSLMLCVSMLVGTTFAWFTDSVTSDNNIIKSGNLDVELEYWNGEDWVDVTGRSDILTNTLWEPGVTEIAYLRIRNAGSLALKYQLGINIVGTEKAGTRVNKETGEDESFKLSDYLDFGVVENVNGETDAYTPDAAGRAQAIAAVGDDAKHLNEGYAEAHMLYSANNIPTDVAGAASEKYFALVVYMPTTVDNRANHKTSDPTDPDLYRPEIDLGINVYAMQVEYEPDSFDEFYDELAIYSDGGHRVLNANLEWDGEPGSDAVLTNETETLIVKAKAGPEGKVSVSVNLEASMVRSNKNVLSYDIKVTGQEAGSTVEVQPFIGKQLTGVLVYHEGDLMDRNQYTYDAISGYVTITTADFSLYDIEFDRSFINFYDDVSDVRNTSGAHIVGQDFEATGMIYFMPGTENTVFLNNFTITAAAENRTQYLFGMGDGGTLRLTGNGNINAGMGFFCSGKDAQIIIDGGTYNTTETSTLNSIKHHSLVQNDSKLVINGGTFTSNVADACLFFATSNGRIEINGGFFENTATKTPDLLSMGTNKYKTNRIVITGGTFVNWNPLNDRMCYKGEWPANGEAAFGGPWMLIPGGYTVVSETQANGDVWYTVVPVESAN